MTWKSGATLATTVAARSFSEQPKPSKPQKRVTKMKFEDLPKVSRVDGQVSAPLDPDWRKQSLPSTIVIPPAPKTSEKAQKPITEQPPKLPNTQLSHEIWRNLQRFPHCLLLTRVGQFYESYFNPAIEVAKLLSIKETSRSWGGERVPMCGFPLAHLDRHLKTLVQQHKRFVALCEEYKKPDGTFDRRVARIVTPGTLIDESFVNHFENNYLLAIGFGDDMPSGDNDVNVGMSWIDVSTGEFFAQSVPFSSLRDNITRISPREIVLQTDLPNAEELVAFLEEEGSLTISYVAVGDSSTTDQSEGSSPSGDIPFVEPPPDDMIMTAQSSASSPTSFTPEEAQAVHILTTFLRANLLECMPNLPSPVHQDQGTRMQIDSHAIKALEIKESMREGGTKGTLLSAVKRTVTTSGTRLLARRICSPSISVPEIRARQSLVALFHSNNHFRFDLRQLIKKTEDTSRIIQKFLFGRGTASDLLDIRDTINIWTMIKNAVELELTSWKKTSRDAIEDEEEMWSNLSVLIGKLEDLSALAKRIESSVDEDQILKRESGPDEQSEEDGAEVSNSRSTQMKCLAWTIRPQFSRHLKALHERLNVLTAQRSNMERELQLRFDVRSLTVRINATGAHVHVGRVKDVRKMGHPDDLVELTKSGSTKTYFYQPWGTLASAIATTENEILDAEKDAFATLRREVNASGTAIRKNGRIIDELDVTMAFAQLADDMNYVRPMVNDSLEYRVVNGRHPTVELGLLESSRNFTPNTVPLTEECRLHVITGPNMAGKSTLLRQTALISILAQTGSFVPADKAEIGIVDKVFSRVGAKDDLFRDRSTFMVEMMETADILNRATPRSLVIMDEVGRGTTVKDGLAIAFATVHHLYFVNKCRALFATHFHDLADMLGYSDDGLNKSRRRSVFPNIGFFCNDVDETEDGHFTYSHRLRPGVNRDSHGLKVAQTGGLPPKAIDSQT
ncbi:DNA mismatch repair ATPase msh1 [Tulasnella sp. 419]|nr:DNA mismatch repair ATPase msh1 [Tulasnella sp. 419]